MSEQLPDYTKERDTDMCLVLLGGGGVGSKSCLVHYLMYGRPLLAYDPTIEDNYLADIVVDGVKFSLILHGLCFSY